MELEILCNSKNSTNKFLNSSFCKNVTKYNYKDRFLWPDIYNVTTTPLNISIHKCIPINKTFKINYSSLCNYKILVNDNSRYIIPRTCSSYIFYDNSEYKLVQCHIHHESENTIDGEIFSIEIHFVHKNSEGEILVLGILLDIDDTKESLFDESMFQAKSGSKINLDFSILNELEKLTCYIFKGTLTTPPFTDGIKWILFSPTDINGLTITNKIYNIFTEECTHNSFRNINNNDNKVYIRKYIK